MIVDTRVLRFMETQEILKMGIGQERAGDRGSAVILLNGRTDLRDEWPPPVPALGIPAMVAALIDPGHQAS